MRVTAVSLHQSLTCCLALVLIDLFSFKVCFLVVLVKGKHMSENPLPQMEAMGFDSIGYLTL